jgi:hypothetical protein
MTTISARTDLRSGIKTVLTTYQAAHPTLISHVYDHPPASPRTPCVYIEKAMPETDPLPTGQIWTRQITSRVVVLNRVVSNDQATSEQDVLAEGLILAFMTARKTIITNGRVFPTVGGDVEVPFGEPPVNYAGFVLTLFTEIEQGLP